VLGFLVVEFLQDLDIYTMVVQLCVELIWTSVLSGPWQSHVLPWGMYGSFESENSESSAVSGIIITGRPRVWRI
jgi:hypothetical protein